MVINTEEESKDDQVIPFISPKQQESPEKTFVEKPSAEKPSGEKPAG
jgi:hypothetical protein